MIETQANTAPDAFAYINFGRWISDCPLGCGNAYGVNPGQLHFMCEVPHGCGHIGILRWPLDAEKLWATLEMRPMPKTRNWFPRNHPLALRSGCPDGQTVNDLLEENRANGVM